MKRTHATQLRDGLKTLGLATIRECYREQADLARKEALPYEGYLLELINRECETRAHPRLRRVSGYKHRRAGRPSLQKGAVDAEYADSEE